MHGFDEEYQKLKEKLIRKLNRLQCDWEDRNLQSLLYHYNKVLKEAKDKEDLVRMERMNILFNDLNGSYVSLMLIDKIKNLVDEE